MPNHWESSARPLFVRTVFVNGNRHAILFEEDPLLRYGNSPFKKISRSNSSLSFSSDLSITSSESQDSISDERVPRLRNSGRRRTKDLSSELQSCLIKLRLASENHPGESKSDEEKCCNLKDEEENQKEVSKHKKNNRKRDKTCRRKHCPHFQVESKENKITGQRENKDNSCYFYNCESSKGKRNYCVVKITSQPPQFTLSCRCDGELGENHKCKRFPSGRNNMLISATIHNLFMTGRKDDRFEGEIDSFFSCDNPDSYNFYWNTYLNRTYYNSLSERVFQWLDLASKKKNQKQKPTLTDEGDTLNSTERIFSGKTFVNESIKTENLDEIDNKQDSKALVKKKENMENISCKEKTGLEVMKKSKIQVFSSTENSQSDSQEWIQNKITRTIKSSTRKVDTSNTSEIISKNTTIQQLTLNTQNSTKSPLKIQDLLLDYNFRENFDFSLGKRSKRKIRETRDHFPFSKTHREFRETVSTEEDENFLTKTLKHWEKRAHKKGNKSDTGREQTPCHCDESSDGYADKIRNELLSERISETNQKSINNVNFTRGRPVLIQNLLPPQQRDDISAVQTEKIVWGSEKGAKRLQLHIFMPSLLLREASEDSTSECDNVFSLC